MSVVSLAILLVSVVCAEDQEDVVVVVLLDTAGAPVMDEGVTVHVEDPLAVVVYLPGAAATAGHLIVGEMRSLMPMGMDLGSVAGAGAKS